jgi:GrpB-like predicted nucleotidyltransferase (UPF0157 family)
LAYDPKYQIIPYQSTWESDFRALANNVRIALGDLALRIDHIGSTSVPGLAAKDIIDIQITVNALDDSVSQKLKSAGYLQTEEIVADHRPPDEDGPDSDWQKYFFRSPDSTLRAHIHVRINGKPNQHYPLLFRDYLRTHPSMAQAYAELKRRLSVSLAEPSTYPDVKDPAVDLIYFAAKDWADQVNWTPGPSDV